MTQRCLFEPCNNQLLAPLPPTGLCELITALLRRPLRPMRQPVPATVQTNYPFEGEGYSDFLVGFQFWYVNYHVSFHRHPAELVLLYLPAMVAVHLHGIVVCAVVAALALVPMKETGPPQIDND